MENKNLDLTDAKSENIEDAATQGSETVENMESQVSETSKTYNKKTNSKGIATLKLPNLANGAYTVKYNFKGNNYYYSSSTSNKVIILSNKNSALSVKSTTTFGHGSSTTTPLATLEPLLVTVIV